jgi:hypothetical protein
MVDTDMSKRLASAIFPERLVPTVVSEKVPHRAKDIISQVQERFKRYSISVDVMKEQHAHLDWLNSLRQKKLAPKRKCQNVINQTLLFHCTKCFEDRETFKVVAYGKWIEGQCLDILGVFHHDSHQQHVSSKIVVVNFDYDEIIGTAYDKIVARVSATKFSPSPYDVEGSDFPKDAAKINGSELWNNTDDRSYILIEDDGSTKSVAPPGETVEEPNEKHAIAMLKLEYFVCATFNMEKSFAKNFFEVKMGAEGTSFHVSVNVDAHHSLEEKSVVFGGHRLEHGSAHRREGDENECIHQMQHRDVTLKDNEGQIMDIKSVLDGKNASGLLPGTLFLPLGPGGREIYIQHPSRKMKIHRGQLLYFDCETTHGGITKAPPKEGEAAQYDPALHLHLDSHHIVRTVAHLNYDTVEASQGIDYFPPEHHRASDFPHMAMHVSKVGFELRNLMESMKRHAEAPPNNPGYLKSSKKGTTLSDWESMLEKTLGNLVHISGSLIAIVDSRKGEGVRLKKKKSIKRFTAKQKRLNGIYQKFWSKDFIQKELMKRDDREF